MKYLKDPNNIIAILPKYLLTYSNPYSSIAYLLRDILNELSIKINCNNKLIVASLFQDIFDIINPYVDNIYSSFHLDEEYDGFTIIFFNDTDELDRLGILIKETIIVKYKEK